MAMILLPAFSTCARPNNEGLINKVFNVRATDLLRAVASESVHLTFTSPPYYNAREYVQYDTYENYLNELAVTFTEVYRVTAEGRFCIVNTSPVITPRKKRSGQSIRHPIPFDLHYKMTQIGWEFIDDIVWVKPEPSVKNRNAGFSQHRKPLAYKPNAITEYVMVYRKNTGKLIDWNLKQYTDEITQKSLIVNDYPSTNVWEIQPSSSTEHPAVFPSELCSNIIRLYSFWGDIVCDPYCGIGTTLHTAFQLGRKYMGCDISPQYCSTANRKVSMPITQTMFLEPELAMVPA